MKPAAAISDEYISAMADGHLDSSELGTALNSFNADEQRMRTWHAYHVVGDVLRSAELAPLGSDFDFLEKLEKRLSLEPANWSTANGVLSQGHSLIRARVGKSSANAPVLRWKLVSGLACTALVGTLAIGQWNRFDSAANQHLSTLAPVAVHPTTPVQLGDANSQAMIRDPVLDSLLAAHHQLGGHSALQRPSGFLRNATYEGTSR